jgi:hypothetical protein
MSHWGPLGGPSLRILQHRQHHRSHGHGDVVAHGLAPLRQRLAVALSGAPLQSLLAVGGEDACEGLDGFSHALHAPSAVPQCLLPAEPPLLDGDAQTPHGACAFALGNQARALACDSQLREWAAR